MVSGSARCLAVGISFPLCLFSLLAAAAVSATTLFVVPGGAGTADCSNWANACTLQSALGTATSGDQVWVDKGVYTPGTHQGDTFTIPPGAAVYGGFAGTETALFERNPVANVTVLSGDIDNNDAVDANGADTDTTKIVGGNSNVVVTINAKAVSKVLSDTVLDGFTITGAGSFAGLWCDNTETFAECSPTLSNLTFSGNIGRALLNDAVAAASKSCPTLTNVTFSGNSGPGGSAMFNHAASGTESSPTLTNVTFRNNHSSNIGGAMFNQAGGGGTSSPVLTNVTFSGNSADTDGGAIYNEGSDSGTSSPVLTNVTFSGNSAVTDGGAIYNHASGASQSISSPTLTNVTFSGNSAGDSGGAIYNNTGSTDYFGEISPVLTNVTFSGNSAGSEGGAMRDESGLGTIHPMLTNVIFWSDSVGAGGNGPEICDGIVCGASGAGPGVTMDYSVYSGFCPGTCTNIVTTDPLLGPLQDNGGPTETMALGAGSSAIDAGDGTACPATDQRGVTRPQDGDNNGTAVCDIGAVEVLSDIIFSDGFEGAPTP